jgi:hypothetical protein
MDEKIKKILSHLVKNPSLQRGFLEALSELENCGAKKIIRYQTPANTDLSILQHAAEETRHAHFFKKQACKFGVVPALIFLDGKSRRYLDRLELFIARCFQEVSLKERKKCCYVLTTFYIEQRATWLYTHYEAQLRSQDANFSLHSILREETGHLAEMKKKKEALGISPELASRIQNYEATLCAEWIETMSTLIPGYLGLGDQPQATQHHLHQSQK